MSNRSCVLAGLLIGAQMLAAPAFADSTPPPADKKPQKTVAAMDSVSYKSALMQEATDLERRGRWLGAVASWRDFARLTPNGSGDHALAQDRLHKLSGLTWLASVKSKNALPLVVGQTVVAVPYEVKFGEGLRSVVTGVDRASGKVLWTREDAVAIPLGDDVAVFVQNWDHVTRVNLRTGGDMWAHAFGHPPSDYKTDGPSRKVVGVSGDVAVIIGDTWPVGLDLNSGAVRWGPNRDAVGGYTARMTAVGVLAYPLGRRPSAVAESAWAAAPMVMLNPASGEILWRRTFVAGEPWKVVFDAKRLYVSDPSLVSEKAWTAVDLSTGSTVWRQGQADARPSNITPTSVVLVETAPSGTTRFLDPASGRKIWQSDTMVRFFPAGPVLETTPEGPVTARDLATGQALWTIPQNDDLNLDPSTAELGSGLYMTAYGVGSLSGQPVPGALSANPGSGKVAWRSRASDTPYEENLAMLSSSDDMLLVERTMRISQPKLAGPFKAGNVSSILALDPGRGDVSWGFYDLAPSRTAPPVRVGNSLLVVGNDKDGHSVYCFDLERIRTLVSEGKRWWW